MTPKPVRRAGTSFREFERKFPDSSACLEYLQVQVYGINPKCPKCGLDSQISQSSSGTHFVSSCCRSAKFVPLKNTIFAKSQLPLIKWFWCLLHFTNASSGVTTDFIRCQLGMSTKASIRVAQKIRAQLVTIDCNIKLQADQRIFVDETTINNISRGSQKNGVKFRILGATDGVEFLMIAIPSGRYATSRDRLFDRCERGSTLEIRQKTTQQKLTNFKNLTKIKGHCLKLTSEPDRQEYHNLTNFMNAGKRFILSTHIWVTDRQLDSYIGHFSFLYRRRYRGQDIFWEALAGCAMPIAKTGIQWRN